MIIDPEHYDTVPVYELLEAASRGYIGLDHRFLRAILDHRGRAIPDLVRYASEDHDDAPVFLQEDLIAIFRYLQALEAVPFYIELIRRDPEDVTDELIDGLASIGQPALEPLLQLYEELGEENSGDVAFLLAALHVRDPRVLDILTDRIEYDLSDATLCLDVYGDPEAIPALERTLEQPDLDIPTRHDLETVIESLRQPREAEPRHPMQPFDIWEIYPEKASPAFEVLTEDERLAMLASDSAELRAEVAGSFTNSDLPDKTKAKLIQVAKRDPDPNVRGRAWEALIDETEEPEIRKGMVAVINSLEAPLEERSGAVVGLARHSDNPRVRKAIEDLYANPAGRAKALEAMWRSFDRTFAAYPPKHLKDTDPQVRRQAIWGVGQLGLAQAAPDLRKFFDDDDFRPDALFNFALSMPADVSRGRIRSLLKRVDEAAGGLTPGETQLVQMALDQRLITQGLKPVFVEVEDDELGAEEPKAASHPGRNDPCPCGSGKKYKKCCGA